MEQQQQQTARYKTSEDYKLALVAHRFEQPIFHNNCKQNSQFVNSQMAQK